MILFLYSIPFLQWMQFNLTQIANCVLFAIYKVLKKGITWLFIMNSDTNHTPIFIKGQLKYGRVTEYNLALHFFSFQFKTEKLSFKKKLRFFPLSVKQEFCLAPQIKSFLETEHSQEEFYSSKGILS